MRRTGRTTRAIQEAPQGAIFVWHDRRFEYVKDIAERLGRTDLKFISIDDLIEDRLRGLNKPIVADHHAIDKMSRRQYYTYCCYTIMYAERNKSRTSP